MNSFPNLPRLTMPLFFWAYTLVTTLLSQHLTCCIGFIIFKNGLYFVFLEQCQVHNKIKWKVHSPHILPDSTCECLLQPEPEQHICYNQCTYITVLYHICLLQILSFILCHVTLLRNYLYMLFQQFAKSSRPKDVILHTEQLTQKCRKNICEPI